MLSGQISAEREPTIAVKKRGFAKNKKKPDFSEIACTEYGTLPRDTILTLGLRHVSTASVVLNIGSRVPMEVYQAEVLDRGQWRTVYVCEEA